MPTKNISQIFGELSFEKKLLGVGSVLLILSLFLPWYQDLDSFKTGDMFLGITGPLYLAGYSLLILAAINIAMLFAEINGRKIPYLSVKPSAFYFATGLFAFFMLLVVNSVYFHAKFGINITLKQSQFGMFFAFIASSFITIGGYLSTRDKASLLREFEDETRDPLIEFPKQEKPRENIRTNVSTEPAMDPVQIQQDVSSAASASGKKSVQPYRLDL
ncbi:hypothetical protein KJ951_02545 [Patescibacteria group bacterium]|nr:hypothetical protein [Patescibacteria group bacterium]MBU1703259.1 hypothetical protein [Patescibacteria group bacterium]MBU1953761.1 hypothetical protein [Patescibacteria group bacterium]